MPQPGSPDAPDAPEGAAAPAPPDPAVSAPAAEATPPSTPSASDAAPAPKPVEKRWYIVHTYSGHEQKAKQGLLERAKALHKEDAFDEILIPEEQVVEVVKGEKRTSKRKFFPGYILVRMALDDETWHIVRGTARITGFVGGAGNKPTPISDDEVARMTQQIKEGAVKPKPKIRFEEGENVRVTSGPFANFQGFVDEVRPDKEKVRVMVQVFGRATPVELDYTQLEKA
jgi:transcriptional antiterminator NusG